MGWMRTSVKWIATGPIATVALIYIGALLEHWFDHWGLLADPDSFLKKATELFVAIYEHPWFTPAAIASIAFAAGAWLDYAAKKMDGSTQRAKEKRKWDLIKRIDSLAYRLDDHRGGVSEYGLYAEVVSLKSAIEAEGLTFPDVKPSTKEGVKILANYLDVLSVFLKHNDIDKARKAHLIFSPSSEEA